MSKLKSSLKLKLIKATSGKKKKENKYMKIKGSKQEKFVLAEKFNHGVMDENLN